MISATVIAHSIADGCAPLYSLELTYPTYLHPMVLEHRAFSRCTLRRSFPDALLAVEHALCVDLPDPQRMHALNADRTDTDAIKLWLACAEHAVKAARELAALDPDNPLAMAILSPFLPVKTLVTATDWDNFFIMGSAEDSPERMRQLVNEMLEAMDRSHPRELGPGLWHTPYLPSGTAHNAFDCARSALCCSLVSDLPLLEVSPHSPDADRKAQSKLIDLGQSGYLSAFEHQATPAPQEPTANLAGWRQFRHILDYEVTDQAFRRPIELSQT